MNCLLHMRGAVCLMKQKGKRKIKLTNQPSNQSYHIFCFDENCENNATTEISTHKSAQCAAQVAMTHY